MSEDCSAELPCHPYKAVCNGDPGTCEAKRVSGGCVLLECVPTYRCTPPLFGGTCNPARPVGASCTPGQYQCESLAHCSDVANQCEPMSGVGDGCGFGFEGEISGCIGGRCAGSACANYRGIGESCTGTAECGPLAHCNGTCVPDFCVP